MRYVLFVSLVTTVISTLCIAAGMFKIIRMSVETYIFFYSVFTISVELTVVLLITKGVNVPFPFKRKKKQK